jgi:hypothetical protein
MGLDLWSLMPISTIFWLYRGETFPISLLHKTVNVMNVAAM